MEPYLAMEEISLGIQPYLSLLQIIDMSVVSEAIQRWVLYINVILILCH